ncbi:hypothetical protein OSB04_016923 [Centaurea solstitialis]|uniref:HAT C-terminal dimerisation domain-containing protein n=1 Tax=Centaurea solstitialis TaxID=347529 RepID=A0AA38TLY9_9ASTR|nr:hypothetical protein OSB04_016923 [Centaurea solstitialis]
MKDLGEAAYILGIKIYRNRFRRLIGLSQSTYIDKIRERFRMDESKIGFIPMQHGIVLSKAQCPVSSQDQDKIKTIPYASAIGSIMYAMLCTRPDVAYSDEISVTGYTDASFQTDRDDFKSQSGYVFTLNKGTISWKSSKQNTIADSTTEAEYIAASDAAKEAVWLRNFILDLRVVTNISRPVDIYSDNSSAVAQAKEPREHQKSRHVLRKYHLIREIIRRGDVRICKIPTDENVADSLTKPQARVKHQVHASSIGMQYLDTNNASFNDVVVAHVRENLSEKLVLGANMHFHKILGVLASLLEWIEDGDPNVTNMGDEMRKKFDIYYGDFGQTNVMVLVVFSPNRCYKMRLYDHYAMVPFSSKNDSYSSFVNDDGGQNFVGTWSEMCTTYKVLASMATDILAILVSTVASESAFVVPIIKKEE